MFFGKSKQSGSAARFQKNSYHIWEKTLNFVLHSFEVIFLFRNANILNDY